MSQASKNIRDSINTLISTLKTIINTDSVLLANKIKVENLTGGTTPTRLRARSGKARASLKAILTTKKADGLTGGVTIGAKYLKTHFGRRGEIVTIKAKPGKALAIPLPAACTKAGVPKGKPRDKSVFGNMNLFPVKSLKTGKMILYGQLKYQKGKNKGQLRSKLVPLFLLTKSVKVTKRIDTMELLKWVEQKIIKDLKGTKIIKGEPSV